VSDLAHGALTVTFDWMALGCERFQVDGASFVRNRSVPRIRDCNQVTDVTAATEAEIDRLLARADREFAGCPHRQFRADFQTPPAFEARLVADGYEWVETLALVLDGDVTGEGPEHDIRPLESAADWEAYGALHALDWGETGEKLPKRPDPEVWRAVGREMVESRRQKTPRPRSAAPGSWQPATGASS